MDDKDRCPECGSYDKECISEVPIEGCGCVRCLSASLREHKEALRDMFKACDEWAAEFIQHKRAMNWGVVNDAYMRAERLVKP